MRGDPTIGPTEGETRPMMKDLIKQYLDQGISRRQLMQGLSAIGLSTVAARAVEQSLAPVSPEQSKTITVYLGSQFGSK